VTTGPLEEDPRLADRQTAGDTIAGLLAAAALFISFVAVAYRPMRLIPAAVILSLTAAAMSDRHRRLTALSVAAVGVCWLVGVTLAVITKNPLY
jgi:preprotein translocase subunit SecD